MIRPALYIILLFFAGLSALNGLGQNRVPEYIKTLSVTDGLPQSFISALVQDSTGFIWVGTRDGLARYDGREFRVFRHIPGDTSTLSDNIVADLYLDKSKNLWIRYEAGQIDILNTATETFVHLTSDSLYRQLINHVRDGHSNIDDAEGNFWIFASGNRLFTGNLRKHSLTSISTGELGIKNDTILGIGAMNGKVIVVTDQSLLTIDAEKKPEMLGRFQFKEPYPADPHKTLPLITRKNGDIIVKDKNRIIIFDHQKKNFIPLSLPPINGYFNFLIIPDSSGLVYFEHNRSTYILAEDNEIRPWQPESKNPVFGFKSMLIDKSGVLWMGGNGTGLHLYDLRLPRLPAFPYRQVYQEDLLRDFVHVPESDIKKTFLHNLEPYQFRWAKGPDGKIWFSNAILYDVKTPQVCFLENNRIVKENWKYADSSIKEFLHFSVLSFSRSGKLWAVDFYMRLVYLDVEKRTATVYPPVGDINIPHAHAVSSMWIDGEDDFWISTVQNGLFHYNRKTNQTKKYTAGLAKGELLTNLLMNIVPDPKDKNILWMGSLGWGLIKFNRVTETFVSYSTKDGLPNNTIYAILPDTTGTLWCSSNKGIFSFNPEKGIQRIFTSKDGLPGDEFNRYHFFALPDGRLSFGGVSGYTVFNPYEVSKDSFEPDVAITGIRINNIPADFGYPGSPFKQAVNGLHEISLPYDQNFLAFSFAAMQYNIPGKIQYRYMLEGINENWVYVGNDNFASYTKIPPGNYVLKINATNTAGQWSSHIKTLPVKIRPPFWQTEWFIALCILVIIGIIYFFIQFKIAAVRKEEQQKADFERKASELKAQALRAQMNPHFFFNCLNSIKALIQDGNGKQAVIYLTTFSKLIRNQLNSAQEEISLQEELETCRLYTQLEALRFGESIVCTFNIEEGADLHSVKVPPLILQPFIENAIWHGILPKGGGSVNISVKILEDEIQCSIEDDGIGRERAMRNKSQTSATYESKGMKLVQGRLNLHNILSNYNDSVELIDKKDTAHNATGTLVIVKFKRQA